MGNTFRFLLLLEVLRLSDDVLSREIFPYDYVRLITKELSMTLNTKKNLSS